METSAEDKAVFIFFIIKVLMNVPKNKVAKIFPNLMLLVMYSGCLLLTACVQSSKVKPPRHDSYSQTPGKGDIERQANQLAVKATEVIPILIGKHQSLRLDIEISNDTDFAWYEIHKDNKNNLIKADKVYLGPVLIHDLPEGMMYISIWACKESSRGSDASEKECGQAYFTRYYQPFNADKELVQYLKQRESLIDKQKDIGEQLVKAVSEYRRANSESQARPDQEFDEFLGPIEEAGAGKVGDLIAKSPGIDQGTKQNNQEPDEEEKEAEDKTDGPLSFSNGIALLYLVGAGIKKFAGDKPLSPEKLKADYKAGMEALSREMSGAMVAKGDLERLKAELNHVTGEIKHIGDSDPHSSRLRDLSEQKRMLTVELEGAEARYQDHSLRHQQILAKELTAAPPKLNAWVKRAGALTALVGAGLILFTSFDEGLLNKLDKFLDKMVFALAGESGGAQFKFKKSLEEIAEQSHSLKSQVFNVEEAIDQHLKNANKN
ncbi:MAG: hypothetical protein HRU09_20915 [Oligoflexales bacterium]|nr:hypothetical protein [Oligoflexales bacterium]